MAEISVEPFFVGCRNVTDLSHLAGIFPVADGNVRILAFLYLIVVILGHIDINADLICILQGKSSIPCVAAAPAGLLIWK